MYPVSASPCSEVVSPSGAQSKAATRNRVRRRRGAHQLPGRVWRGGWGGGAPEGCRTGKEPAHPHPWTEAGGTLLSLGSPRAPLPSVAQTAPVSAVSAPAAPGAEQLAPRGGSERVLQSRGGHLGPTPQGPAQRGGRQLRPSPPLAGGLTWLLLWGPARRARRLEGMPVPLMALRRLLGPQPGSRLQGSPRGEHSALWPRGPGVRLLGQARVRVPPWLPWSPFPIHPRDKDPRGLAPHVLLRQEPSGWAADWVSVSRPLPPLLGRPRVPRSAGPGVDKLEPTGQSWPSACLCK